MKRIVEHDQGDGRGERAVAITPRGNLLWSFPTPSFERAFIGVRSVKDFARDLEHEKDAEAGGGRDDKHL